MGVPGEQVRVEQVLTAMLAMQRLPWEQGVAAHALIDLGRDDLVRLIARDAVNRQSVEGRLGDLDDGNPVNGAPTGEAVVAQLRTDPGGPWRQALDRQLDWLARVAPRAHDGALHHVAGTAQIWVDTVYMVMPLLTLAGRIDEADRQFAGHRRRLFVPSHSLYHHIWDDETATCLRPVPWASGNGWVVAGLARALHHLSTTAPGMAPGMAPDTGPATGTTMGSPADAAEQFRTDAQAHVRVVAEGMLAHRARGSGLFHDVLDDPDSFDDATSALMLAYALFTGVADGWLEPDRADTAGSLLEAAIRRVDDDGVVTGVCGSPRFDRPGHSVEAQAFFLLATSAGDRLG